MFRANVLLTQIICCVTKSLDTTDLQVLYYERGCLLRHDPKTFATVVSVRDQVLKKREENPPTVVLIGGPNHSGKSRLSSKLATMLSDLHILVTALSNDLWLVGGVPPPGMTPPEYVNADAFANDISRLVKGEAIRPPVFNFQTGVHERNEGDDEVSLRQGDVLILDGSLVLNNPGLEWLNPLKIYVAIPEDYRRRWKEGCREGLTGATWGHEGETAIAKASRQKADLIYQPHPDNLPEVAECHY